MAEERLSKIRGQVLAALVNAKPNQDDYTGTNVPFLSFKVDLSSDLADVTEEEAKSLLPDLAKYFSEKACADEILIEALPDQEVTVRPVFIRKNKNTLYYKVEFFVFDEVDEVPKKRQRVVRILDEIKNWYKEGAQTPFHPHVPLYTEVLRCEKTEGMDEDVADDLVGMLVALIPAWLGDPKARLHVESNSNPCKLTVTLDRHRVPKRKLVTDDE